MRLHERCLVSTMPYSIDECVDHQEKEYFTGKILITKNVYTVAGWVYPFIRRSLQATYNNLFYQFRFIVLRHILGAFRVFVLFLFLYHESNLI